MIWAFRRPSRYKEATNSFSDDKSGGGRSSCRSRRHNLMQGLLADCRGYHSTPEAGTQDDALERTVIRGEHRRSTVLGSIRVSAY